MNKPIPSIESESRRNMLKASAVAVIAAAAADGQAATGIIKGDSNAPVSAPPGKLALNTGQNTIRLASAGTVMPSRPAEKPTFVAEARDPVSFSRAENLFWNDILMEHAQFFVTMLPGQELAAERRQAEDFQRIFAEMLRQSGGVSRENYIAFNQRSMDQARRFADWKKMMEERQKSGRIHSLAYPLFYQHTAREADRYAARLAQFNRGTVELDRAEVVDFWSKTMGEHSGFIGHLVDPTEKQLRNQAYQYEKAFLRQGVQGEAWVRAAREVVEFHMVGERGIHEARIKSIIHPAIASHMRREAVRFIDELNRT
jgi:hypothetical protein